MATDMHACGSRGGRLTDERLRETAPRFTQTMERARRAAL